MTVAGRGRRSRSNKEGAVNLLSSFPKTPTKSKVCSAKHVKKKGNRQSWHSRESAGWEKRWFSWLRSSNGRSQRQEREKRDLT